MFIDGKKVSEGPNEAEGAGSAGSSVTIVGEQSDIKSYQPFTSYPHIANSSVLPLLLKRKDEGEHTYKKQKTLRILLFSPKDFAE